MSNLMINKRNYKKEDIRVNKYNRIYSCMPKTECISIRIQEQLKNDLIRLSKELDITLSNLLECLIINKIKGE